MDYFIDPLKKYAEFTGRARRQEFWMFTLICISINFILEALGLDTISLIVSFVLLVPSISLGARRLHDTGRSGWWQLIYLIVLIALISSNGLISLISLIGLIVMIVFLVQDSHADNDYGVNPKSGVTA